MKRLDIALLIGLFAAVLLGSFTGFGAEYEEVREGVVRLHLLANSDSEEDQSLKLAVRDALLVHTKDIFGASEDKIEAERLAADNLHRIEAIAREEIQRQGYDYPVKAELVNMYFDTRYYGDLTVAAGRYDAVRVTIGEGAGQNWWCVMFPPMCVPAAEAQGDKLPLAEQMENLGTQPQYVPKFAVVEWIERIRDKLDGEGDIPLELPAEEAVIPRETENMA